LPVHQGDCLKFVQKLYMQKNLRKLSPIFCTPEMAARNKDALFPGEGGPAIMEVSVPAWILAILFSDSIAAGLARSGEIRFEPESGLNELRAEWHNLTKPVIPL
jgi:hypothetical protein